MPGSKPLSVLLLAHDLSDAAIARRIQMLQQGGAVVTVAGFRRTEEPISNIKGCDATNFGRTYNAGFVQRIVAILILIFDLKRYQSLYSNVDIIIARNLEMLAIAVRAQSLSPNSPKIIYECLDIHRLLIKQNVVGSILRSLEGWLSKRASALFTSSPAFVSNYFMALSKVKLPVRLIENKVLTSSHISPLATAISTRPHAPPWTIGWFGIIRCKKSFALLKELVENSQGSIKVIIRGKPATDIFNDFEALTSNILGLSYLGPYQNPEDLATIYRDIHFIWTIDKFEEGLNSSWLLPNRLYEGGMYGAVPIALETVETGRFLKELGIGLTVNEPLDHSLKSVFKNLTFEQYLGLQTNVLKVPQKTWTYNLEDCRDLVAYLKSLLGEHNGRHKAP